MSNAQSINHLRVENKKLKELVASMSTEYIRLEDKRKALEHLLLLRERKTENLENLVGVLNTRLARMADRLTNLAAERNHLYLEVQHYKESWEQFSEGLDQVGRGDDRP